MKNKYTCTCNTDNKVVPIFLSDQSNKIRGIVQSTILVFPVLVSLRWIWNKGQRSHLKFLKKLKVNCLFGILYTVWKLQAGNFPLIIMASKDSLRYAGDITSSSLSCAQHGQTDLIQKHNKSKEYSWKGLYNLFLTFVYKSWKSAQNAILKN